MYRLSLIISEIYNKYLPLAEKGGISLNLDFSDITKTVTDPETIKKDLDEYLSSALNRSDRGEISIAVDQDAILITDSGTILSKPICILLSKGRVSVTSRVGFGTTIRISLQSASKPSPSPEQTTEPSPSLKPMSTKITREQRKLIAAAKKADRRIQKLRRAKQKQASQKLRQEKRSSTKSQKLTKPQKSAPQTVKPKQSVKPKTKTPKSPKSRKIIELS